MPTTLQTKVDDIQAKVDAQNRKKALINLANVYSQVDAKSTPKDTIVPNTTVYNPSTATPWQQIAAQNLQNKGIDPTKVGTGTGNTYQPYAAPTTWGPALAWTTPTVTKPTIATTETPVIGTPPATTPKITTNDFSTMTPEQLKAQYMSIGTKLPWEVTDEDRRFTKYLQTRMSLGETPDKIFGTSASKSSWTTTYSQQLNRDPSMYQSSIKNADGTWTVTYKDGGTQTISENPTTTVFPEWTPEYYAQKQADEAEKRVQVLTETMTKEEERRKKETADLVAKYGENIATQFQTQKADIEANGAKRMDTLNTGLSFSGFGRSTVALEKRDEIAKNIETTINQAKAKADLELMAYRMEREWADAEAISAMRNNIAQVQANIDDANYKNQLEIIKLNQENATTGAEAMNNLLTTISDSEQIVSNADIEKSQQLGYFVNKDGSIMLDSQKRPIQFEGTPWSLDPSAIGAYADALNKGVIDEKSLDKLSPTDKAAVLKHVGVQNNTYVAPVSVVDFIKSKEWFRAEAYDDATGKTLAPWETPRGTATIGFGQTSINWVPVKWGDTITQGKADEEMRRQIEQKYSRYKTLVTVPLNETQKAALTSLEYNIWPWVWQLPWMKDVITAINASDFNKAADLIVSSKIGIRNAKTGEVLPWLIKRREEEANMLRQTQWGGDTTKDTAFNPDFESYYKKFNLWGWKWLNATETKILEKEFGSIANFAKQSKAYGTKIAVEQALPALQDYKKDLQWLKDNYSVLWKAGSIIGVWDFDAILANVKNKQAFQELTRLKESGATFGALSEKEFANIGSSTEVGKLRVWAWQETWNSALDRLIRDVQTAEDKIKWQSGSTITQTNVSNNETQAPTAPQWESDIFGSDW